MAILALNKSLATSMQLLEGAMASTGGTLSESEALVKELEANLVQANDRLAQYEAQQASGGEVSGIHNATAQPSRGALGCYWASMHVQVLQANTSFTRRCGGRCAIHSSHCRLGSTAPGGSRRRCC